MTALDDFAAYIAAMRADDASVQSRLRLHVADTVGANLSAMSVAEGVALCRWPAGLPRLQDAREVDLGDHVGRHAALARSSEIDDIHLASLTTPGSVVVSAALVAATFVKDTKSEDVAAAILAGYEAMIRLGLVIDGASALYRGIWPTCFLAPFATAAVVSRLLRLDARATAEALGIALVLGSPNVGNHHASTTARWWLIGQGAKAGVAAAFAARAGFTNDVNVLQSGFLNQAFGLEPKLDRLTEGAGQRSLLNEISFKMWCASRQTMAAAQGLRRIVEAGLAPDSIVKVTAYVPTPHFKMTAHGVQAGDRASYLTSLPYQLAAVALSPQRQLDLVTREPIDANLVAFMERVSVVVDDTLLAKYPSVWAARLVAETADGIKEETVHDILGDEAQPPSEAVLYAKYKIFAAPMSRSTDIDTIWSRALSCLTSMDTLRSLVGELDALAAQVGAQRS